MYPPRCQGKTTQKLQFEEIVNSHDLEETHSAKRVLHCRTSATASRKNDGKTTKRYTHHSFAVYLSAHVQRDSCQADRRSYDHGVERPQLLLHSSLAPSEERIPLLGTTDDSRDASVQPQLARRDPEKFLDTGGRREGVRENGRRREVTSSRMRHGCGLALRLKTTESIPGKPRLAYLSSDTPALNFAPEVV